jgi:hypothetical protein
VQRVLDSLIDQGPQLNCSRAHSFIRVAGGDRKLLACGGQPFQNLTLPPQLATD